MMRDINSVQLTQQDRARLRKLVTEYSGLDEPALADTALQRAIAQRLVVNQLNLLSDYWPLLRRAQTGREELGSLVQLLTNKETFFFREAHQFEVLRDTILPELLAVRTTPLRLWSAGCATGEEPYTLAIILLEYQARHGNLDAQIIATDIDAEALNKARQGCYGERSVRLVPKELRRRYFSYDGKAYCVSPQVAQMVTFKQHNLASEGMLPDAQGLDVIFCRNVTIYLDETTRDRLNARLADSLRDGGYLFVASAETMGHDRDRLELISTEKTFLFRKTVPATSQPLSVSPIVPRDRTRSAPVHPKKAVVQAPVRKDADSVGAEIPPAAPLSPAFVFPRAVRAFQRQDYGAALQELDRLPDSQTFWPDVCGLRAATLLQHERLDEAEADCQQLLAHDPWHADAHFLMGLILRQQGQLGEAIHSLKQAIYLHPPHRDAHFFLAEVYHAQGSMEQAYREYRNTLNILTHRPENALTIHLSGLKDDIVRQACEVNLNKLQRRGRTPSGRKEA